MLKEMLEKKRLEKEREEKKKTAKKLAVGAAIGTVVGAAAGVLLAPQSGKETRKEIGEKTTMAVDSVKSSLEELQVKAGNVKENIKNKVSKAEVSLEADDVQ